MRASTGEGGSAAIKKNHRWPNLMSPLRVMAAGLVLALLAGPQSEASFAFRRKAMVADQIAARGIHDGLVLKAMAEVPRHLFVPADLAEEAYSDAPLPIGDGQTISQPYIVALMTESLRLQGVEKVLEVGTGSGYQAAVLSRIAGSVYTIEIQPGLARRAAATLQRLGYANVHVRAGDGFFGWPEQAPFDAMVVTAAAPRMPPALFAQLAEGGRLVLPLGDPASYQRLTIVTKRNGQPRIESILGVRFVPMTGEIQKKK